LSPSAFGNSLRSRASEGSAAAVGGLGGVGGGRYNLDPALSSAAAASYQQGRLAEWDREHNRGGGTPGAEGVVSRFPRSSSYRGGGMSASPAPNSYPFPAHTPSMRSRAAGAVPPYHPTGSPSIDQAMHRSFSRSRDRGDREQQQHQDDLYGDIQMVDNYDDEEEEEAELASTGRGLSMARSPSSRSLAAGSMYGGGGSSVGGGGGGRSVVGAGAGASASASAGLPHTRSFLSPPVKPALPAAAKSPLRRNLPPDGGDNSVRSRAAGEGRGAGGGDRSVASNSSGGTRSYRAGAFSVSSSNRTPARPRIVRKEPLVRQHRGNSFASTIATTTSMSQQLNSNAYGSNFPVHRTISEEDFYRIGSGSGSVHSEGGGMGVSAGAGAAAAAASGESVVSGGSAGSGVRSGRSRVRGGSRVGLGEDGSGSELLGDMTGYSTRSRASSLSRSQSRSRSRSASPSKTGSPPVALKEIQSKHKNNTSFSFGTAKLNRKAY
jgi:hypothetical protein